MASKALSTSEVVKRGEEIYENKLRFELETEENIGKYLVIEVETGDYEMDVNHMKASMRAHEKRPNGEFYAMRVGYDALGAMGGSIQRRVR